MNDYQEAHAVRREAQRVLNTVNAETTDFLNDGVPVPDYITAAGRDALAVIRRAAAIEAAAMPSEDEQPLVAAVERLDPDEFGRRVRARRAMSALRGSGKEGRR